jgi:hypothetical protein
MDVRVPPSDVPVDLGLEREPPGHSDQRLRRGHPFALSDLEGADVEQDHQEARLRVGSDLHPHVRIVPVQPVPVHPDDDAIDRS